MARGLLLRARKGAALRLGKGAIVLALLLSPAAAQPLRPDELLKWLRQLPAQILRFRDQLLAWVHNNDLYLFMLVLVVPMLIIMYFDAKLVFRELRDITLYLLRRKELTAIEKRWYAWRMGMRLVGIIILNVSIILIAGALAWMAQFKHLSDMFAALEKMRRKENLLQILQKFLLSLRRR